jgi:PPOX class probable F420-dependent enzyme
VWVVGLDSGELGFWTSSGSGKAKRLAHTSRVLVQPSDPRGRPKAGSAETEASARLVTGGPEMDEIRRKIKAKYGVMTTVSKVLNTIGGTLKRKKIPYGDRGVVISLPS